MSLKGFISQSMELALMILVAALESNQLFFGFKIKNKFMKLFISCYLFQHLFTVMFEAVIANESFLDSIVLFSDEFANGKRKSFVFR